LTNINIAVAEAVERNFNHIDLVVSRSTNANGKRKWATLPKIGKGGPLETIHLKNLRAPPTGCTKLKGGKGQKGGCQYATRLGSLGIEKRHPKRLTPPKERKKKDVVRGEKRHRKGTGEGRWNRIELLLRGGSLPGWK